MKPNLMFIGAGSMAEAIVKGLIKQNVTEASQITVCNRSDRQKLADLQTKYGVSTCTVDEQLFHDALAAADILVLAMKPKDAGAAMHQLRPLLRPDQAVVSVIAGLSIATMQLILGKEVAIVRTMPNTSATIGLGATGISFSSHVSSEQKQIISNIFAATGIVIEVMEPLLDTVTGLSGSGPAYIYFMMEALMDAGTQLGLTGEQARELTIQTILGAAQMVRETGEHPAELRAKVTSPNGTTQAALELMGERQFQETVFDAVHRAKERAGELGIMISEMVNK